VSHGHERINRVVATLDDGRTVAKGVRTYTVPIGGGNLHAIVTVPNLTWIEEVIEVQWYAVPPTAVAGGHQQKEIPPSGYPGNVVGMTLYDIIAGTTLTVEVIAIGI
jgi:hypothetical protein